MRRTIPYDKPAVQHLTEGTTEGVVYTAAVYISAVRWGEDDPDAAEDTQSEILKRYMASHPEIKKYGTYRDRNRTRDQDRELLHLLDDAECRKFNTVIVRSIRDFGRNFHESAFYLGQFLYPGGVRFISVEDDFDSLIGNVNDYLQNFRTEYHKHHTRAISAMAHRKELRTGAIVPYGYTCGADSETLSVDPLAAEAVRRMFQMRLQGHPLSAIVAELNAKGYSTPQVRKRELYGYKEETDNTLWNTSTVAKLLDRRFYAVGSGNEGLSVEHEALVSERDFDRVQAMKRPPRIKAARNRVFTRMIVCGRCGYGMNSSSFHDEAHTTLYSCESHNRYGVTSCSRYAVREDHIMKQVRIALWQEIKDAMKSKDEILSLSEKIQEQKKAFEKWKQKALEETAKDRELPDFLKKVIKAEGIINSALVILGMKNEWIRLFTAIPFGMDQELDRKTITETIERVTVFPDGAVVPCFRHRETREHTRLVIRQLQEGKNIWEEDSI